jgi:hypothetical protein
MSPLEEPAPPHSSRSRFCQAMLEVGAGYLPEFIRNEVLPSLPRRSGEGIHRALYDLARVLTPWRTAAQREAILRSYAAQCDRHVPETEIQAALRGGARRAWKPNGSNGERATRSSQPKFNLEAFKRFVADHAPGAVDAQWLIEHSPIAPANQTPANFLGALFEIGEHILIFDAVCSAGSAIATLESEARTAERGSWDRFVKGARCGIWFLSNPIDRVWRPNSDAKWSLRSEGNLMFCFRRNVLNGGLR